MAKPTTYHPEHLHFLKMLAKQYPTVQAASTEIINLQAIRNLPKGTEHFISDVHGEHEAFQHILASASGVVREKVEELFGTTMTRHERDQLAVSKALEDCVLYGRIILCALPAYVLQMEFQSFFIAAEKPQLGLTVTVLSGVGNMVLDALFVKAYSCLHVPAPDRDCGCVRHCLTCFAAVRL